MSTLCKELLGISRGVSSQVGNYSFVFNDFLKNENKSLHVLLLGTRRTSFPPERNVNVLFVVCVHDVRF